MAESRPAKKDAGDTVRALLGRAAPPPPRAPAPDADAPAAAPEDPGRVADEPAGEPSAAKRTPRKQPVEPAPAADPDGQTTQTRIPAALFEAVRAAKAKSGDTHEMWFLDALDAVIDDLAEVYRPSVRRSSRVPVRRRRTRRPATDPLVAYPLRLNAEERALLQDLVDELGPPSLADLVTTVVRLRLEQIGQGGT